MRPTRAIRDTLLKALFSSSPPHSTDIFDHENRSIFPSRETFVLFLKAKDSQERVERAKKILRRMSFESAVLPASHVLLILETEEELGVGAASGKYVHRDHFVHLVNLYLLGIYVFFYHKKFNRILLSHFKEQRRLGGDRDVCAFRAFLFCWKAFVLGHDVGYAMEIGPAKGSAFPVALATKRRSFANVITSITSEVGLTFLSRLTAISVANKTASGFTLAQDIAEFPRDLFIAAPLVKAGEFEQIPILHGPTFNRWISTLVPQSDLVAVLAESRSGRPVCALTADATGKHTITWLGKQRLDISPEELAEMAFFQGQTPAAGKSTDFEWRIYCREYSTLTSRMFNRLRSELKCHFTIKEIADDFVDLVATDISLRDRIITSDRDLRNCAGAVFERLLEWSLDGEGSVGSHAATRAAQRSAGSIGPRIVGEILAFIENKIATHLREDKLDLRTLLSARHGGLTRAVSTCIEGFIPRQVNADLNLFRQSLLNEVEARVSRALRLEIQRFTTLEKGIETSKQLVEAAFSEKAKSFFILADEDRTLSPDLEAIREVEEEWQILKRYLDRAFLPSLSDLVKKYPSPTGYGMDHGIASALNILNYARAIKINTDAASHPELMSHRFVNFCLDSLSVAGRGDIQSDLSLIQEVAYAVLLHNLYPDKLNEIGVGDFKVQMLRDPFAYFAMFCDALQRWDRDQRIKQALKQLQPKVTGDCFNLWIDDDRIFVSEAVEGGDIISRAESIKSGLDSYLEGAGKLIWIELADWDLS
jgi:hypothetical protein